MFFEDFSKVCVEVFESFKVGFANLSERKFGSQQLFQNRHWSLFTYLSISQIFWKTFSWQSAKVKTEYQTFSIRWFVNKSTTNKVFSSKLLPPHTTIYSTSSTSKKVPRAHRKLKLPSNFFFHNFPWKHTEFFICLWKFVFQSVVTWKIAEKKHRSLWINFVIFFLWSLIPIDLSKHG